jgi:hypothetical protein
LIVCLCFAAQVQEFTKKVLKLQTIGNFTDLIELRAKVGRDPSERPPPRERGEIRPPQSPHRATVTSPRWDVNEFNS